MRLHGPWHAHVVATFGAKTDIQEQKTILNIPSNWSSWLGEGFCGKVLFSRTFGKPTSLDSSQAVWLVVSAAESTGAVILNKTILGSASDKRRLRVRVEQLLCRRNRLEIMVELTLDQRNATGAVGGLVGGVFLEIEE